MAEQFYTVKEAAAVAHLSGKWMSAVIAKIPGGFKTDGPKGDWRISEEDLERWLRERQVHG